MFCRAIAAPSELKVGASVSSEGISGPKYPRIHHRALISVLERNSASSALVKANLGFRILPRSFRSCSLSHSLLCSKHELLHLNWVYSILSFWPYAGSYNDIHPTHVQELLSFSTFFIHVNLMALVRPGVMSTNRSTQVQHVSIPSKCSHQSIVCSDV